MKEPDWQAAAQKLIELALREDLGDVGDITTTALVPADQKAVVQIVARSAGVIAGLPVARLVFDRVDPEVRVECRVPEGAAVASGQVVAELDGPLRSLLVGERTCLNFLTHLCGIATLTRRFVEAVAGTRAGIYDTRKTLPGWRLLEKQAVLAGGGRNHRLGLYDMVLIKDNHLAGWLAGHGGRIADAIRQARQSNSPGVRVEVEVDTLEQFADALSGQPDIVLLDNMTVAQLRQAVAWRDAQSPRVELEASGGVSLATVGEIARTGVERISVGSLTHSPPALDLAFDWKISQ